ncbi:MAG: cell surface protein SprA, partial [Chitinophagia bacterium]|nr:cell surface protein SprA [Chitinophagia bacterium]
PDDVLGVAYRYTYKGKVYQVGEFAEDLPPDTLHPKVLFVKLLKGTSNRPALPLWKLMMKNVYQLGGYGLTRENFMLNVFYQDPAGGEKRYMPEGPKEGTPFISLLNLDRLNAQGLAEPDGVFDFVDGVTINVQQGKVIFPVLEPFGSDLSAAQGLDTSRVLKRRYIYQVLYDSTKTIAQQYQSQNRYIIKGTYKSASGSEIFLGGFNIPPGSVSVSAGGTKLVENQDYQIEYGLGRIKILNAGILNSGVPINIQYEDNSTFGFQQQNFMGTRFDYYANKNLTIGGTFMRLTERPFTQKVNFGEDPIKNTVLGLDANYQNEVPAITRLVDKLPIYSTTAPSYINASSEVAGIFPGHPKQINALDPEGAVYIDDFEGTTSAYDLRFPAMSWSLASTPDSTFLAASLQTQT